MKFNELFKALRDCESGATAVEYGLIVSLLVIAIISALNNFANETIAMWGHIQGSLESVQ